MKKPESLIDKRMGGVRVGTWLLMGILGLGLLLRVYQSKERFFYAHDTDLGAWMVKDIVVNKHLRLVGQMTSTQGVFIGPIYYYSLVPFYVLFGMDPIGGVAMVAILGVFSIWSYYFVFRRLFGETAGLVAGWLYAVSFLVVFNDRSVVPVVTVLAWSVWWFYGVNRLLNSRDTGIYVLLGGLAGLIWHINLGLVLVLPLVVAAWILSRKRINGKGVVLGVGMFILLNLPFVVFELRHNLVQVRSTMTAMTTNQKDIYQGIDRFWRVWYLAGKNVVGLTVGEEWGLSPDAVLVGVLLIFGFLGMKKVLERNQVWIIAGWLGLYIGFFTIYSKSVSEYYLDGMTPVWVAIVVLGIVYLLYQKRLFWVGLVILGVLGVVNLQRFFGMNINRNGYVERKALVEFVKQDAAAHEYPCVAISYMTSPGYDLGYRYLYYRAGLHVNRPVSGSPVYSVVFPLNLIDRVDKTFGALGLVLPDYGKYNKERVEESCSGADSNLTDPMFGYTE